MATDKLIVGFTYDAKHDYELNDGDNSDKFAEFDSEATISEIENALISGGHEVVRIGNCKSLINRLLSNERWDIVFNIAEGLHGRNRESQVPVILELFDIPYVGSDGLTMAMTLDKPIAKKILQQHNILTPDFIEVDSVDAIKNINHRFPLIVKPTREGTSKGLDADSVVYNTNDLRKRVRYINELYKQPALVEEFIIGREFTVAVLGNQNPEVLPPVQISIRGDTELGEEFYTHSRVESNEIQYICPSRIDLSLLNKIKDMAYQSYMILGCRDFGRIDIRVDDKNNPYFLECNPLPNLGRIDVFPLIARVLGKTYNEIICRILNYALERYNIKYECKKEKLLV